MILLLSVAMAQDDVYRLGHEDPLSSRDQLSARILAAGQQIGGRYASHRGGDAGLGDIAATLSWGSSLSKAFQSLPLCNYITSIVALASTMLRKPKCRESHT